MSKQIIDLKIFAERLSSLLKESPETIYTLADKLSLSAPTISRYANAQMAPKVPTVFAMANIFKVNPQWLMGYNVPMEQKLPVPPDDEDRQLNNEIFDLIIQLSPEELQRVKDFVAGILASR